MENDKLKCKKGIGIFAIILGFLRFVSAYGLIGDLNELKGYTLYNVSAQIANELSYLIRVTETYLIFTVIATLGIAIMGIVLLSTEKGLGVDDARPESRKMAKILLGFEIAHGLCEIIYLIAVSGLSSIRGYMSTGTVIFSLLFLGALILLTLFGLSTQADTSYTSIPITATTSTTKTDPITPSEKNTSTLDDEIEQLRKQIEKRKLEQELAIVNEEKKEEIERLKQELKELLGSE